MTVRNLLTDPIWKGEELGAAIPDSPHAVSVALPRWQDVVGYEEKDPAVISRLTTGYPRFVIHPLIERIALELGGGSPNALPFPSARVAAMCGDFIRRSGVQEVRVVERLGIHAVVTTAEGYAAARAFWQHTGLGISTRQAEAYFSGDNPGSDRPDAGTLRTSLRKQLAGFYDCAEDDVFLVPTGMSAVFAALRAVIQRRPKLPTAQLGFPYVDTLKLQQKFGHGAEFFHDLKTIADDLAALLERQSLAACFCEIPGNPLLGSIDVRRISPLLRERGVPLVVDDVVATSFNIDLARCADLIATSLTKYIGGTGDAMGGALICRPESPFYAELKAIVAAEHEELLWGADAAVFDEMALTFPERMKRHNENGAFIAERLREHPAVERVWYPKWEFSEAYDAVRRPGGGWGSLITFLPKNGEVEAPRVYDRLELSKGPSLGTLFTLACPFTLLAHYTELEWAQSCSVSPYLIRISIGLEDPEEIWSRLDRALTER